MNSNEAFDSYSTDKMKDINENLKTENTILEKGEEEQLKVQKEDTEKIQTNVKQEYKVAEAQRRVQGWGLGGLVVFAAGGSFGWSDWVPNSLNTQEHPPQRSKHRRTPPTTFGTTENADKSIPGSAASVLPRPRCSTRRRRSSARPTRWTWRM